MCGCGKAPRLDCHVYSLIKQGIEDHGNCLGFDTLGDRGVGTGGWKDHPNLVLCSKEQGIKGKGWEADRGGRCACLEVMGKCSLLIHLSVSRREAELDSG